MAGIGRTQQLSITSFSYLTDTINSSTTTITLFNVKVQNQSLFPFSDSLGIGFGVADTGGVIQQMDTTYVGVQTIAALDSIIIASVDFTVNTSLYKEGNNTVVIWPYSNTGATKDSLYFTFIYLGVKDLEANNLPIKIGPNPASEFFFIADPEKVVKRVRIRNAEGKLIQTAISNTMIWTGNLENGMYIVEMETKKGIATRKLIIQK